MRLEAFRLWTGRRRLQVIYLYWLIGPSTQWVVCFVILSSIVPSSDFLAKQVCLWSIFQWFAFYITYITYTIIHYNPSVRISRKLLTPLNLCALILYISSGNYSLKSTPNDRLLINFSWQFYLLSEFLPEICWEAVAEKYFFFHITWPGIRTRA